MDVKKLVQGAAKGVMKNAERRLDGMERESARSGWPLNDKYYRAKESYSPVKAVKVSKK